MARANTRQSGTGEFEIKFAILELMKDQKIWSNADLRFRLKKSFAWSSEDLEVGERKNEYKWEIRVNNALAQGRKSSLYGAGHVVNCGDALHKISESGLKFINDDFDIDDLMNAL